LKSKPHNKKASGNHGRRGEEEERKRRGRGEEEERKRKNNEINYINHDINSHLKE
jgi:hypothetical protein